LKSPKLDAPHTATVTDADNESNDRQRKLTTLYFSNYTNLKDSAYERFPDLLPWDSLSAMERVAALLPEYGGPTEDDAFLRWAKRITVQESFRYICLALANGEYRRMILATIAKEMWTSAQDRSVEPEDLFSEVLALIFDRAPIFLRRKRASLSTRMCALAKRHVIFDYNSKVTKRLAAVKKHLENDGVFEGAETLSAVEIASMRKDRAVSDLGYAEAGFHLA
jgi:hypothetical protein